MANYNTAWMAAAIRVEAAIVASNHARAAARVQAQLKARAEARAQADAAAAAEAVAEAVKAAKAEVKAARAAAKAIKAAKAAKVAAAKVAAKAAKAAAKAVKAASAVGAKAFTARQEAIKALKVAPGCKSRAKAKAALVALPTAAEAFKVAFEAALTGRKVGPTPKAPKGQGRRKARLKKAIARAAAAAKALMARVQGLMPSVGQHRLAFILGVVNPSTGREFVSLVDVRRKAMAIVQAWDHAPAGLKAALTLALRTVDIQVRNVYRNDELVSACYSPFNGLVMISEQALESADAAKILIHEAVHHLQNAAGNGSVPVYPDAAYTPAQVAWVKRAGYGDEDLAIELEAYGIAAAVTQNKVWSALSGVGQRFQPSAAVQRRAYALSPAAKQEKKKAPMLGTIVPTYLDELRQLLRTVRAKGLTGYLLGCGWSQGFAGVFKGDNMVSATEAGILINGCKLRDHGVVLINGPWEKDFERSFQTQIAVQEDDVALLVAMLADQPKLLSSLAHDVTKGAVVEGLAYEVEAGRAAVVSVSLDYGAVATHRKPTKQELGRVRDLLLSKGHVAACNATFESVSVGNGALALSFGIVDGRGNVGFVVDKVHKVSNRLKLNAKATCQSNGLVSSVTQVRMGNGIPMGITGRKLDFVYAESVVAQTCQGLSTVRRWAFPPVLVDVDIVRKVKVDANVFDKSKAAERVALVDAPEFSVGETVAIVDGVHQLVFTGPANTRLSRVEVRVDVSKLSLGVVELGVHGVAEDASTRQKFVAPGLKASVSEQSTFQSLCFNGVELEDTTVFLHNDTVKDLNQFAFWAAGQWAGDAAGEDAVYDPMVGYTEGNKNLVQAYKAENVGTLVATSTVHSVYLPLLEKAVAQGKALTYEVDGDVVHVVETLDALVGSVVAPIEYSPTAASVNTSFMMPAVLGVVNDHDSTLGKAFFGAAEAKTRRRAHKGFARMMAPNTMGLPEGLAVVDANTNWANDKLIELVRKAQEEQGLGGFVLPQPCDLMRCAAKAFPDGIVLRKVLAGQGAKDESFYVDFVAVAVLGGLVPGDEVSGFAEHVHTLLVAAVLRGLGMDDAELSEVLGAECRPTLNEALNRISPAMREASVHRKFKTHIVGSKGFGRKVDTTASASVAPWTVHINPNDEVVVGTKLDAEGNAIEGPIREGEVVFIQRAPMFTMVPFVVVLDAKVPMGVARVNAICWPPANEGDADGDGLTMFPLPGNVVGERRLELQRRMWAFHESATASWAGYFHVRALEPVLGNVATPYAKDVLKFKAAVSTLGDQMGGSFELGAIKELSADEKFNDFCRLQDVACDHLVKGVSLTYAFPMVASHLAMAYTAAGHPVLASEYRAATEWLMRLCYEGWGLGGDYDAVEKLTAFVEGVKAWMVEGGDEPEVPFSVTGFDVYVINVIAQVVLALKVVERGRVQPKNDTPLLDCAKVQGFEDLPLTVYDFALLSSVLRRGGTHGGVSVHARQDFLAPKARQFPVEALLSTMTAVEAASVFGQPGSVVHEQMLETIPFQQAFVGLLRDQESAVVRPDVLATYLKAEGLKDGDIVTLTFLANGYGGFLGGRLVTKGRAYVQAKVAAVNGTADFVHVLGNGQRFDLAAGDLIDANVSLGVAEDNEHLAAIVDELKSGSVTLKVKVKGSPSVDVFNGKTKLNVRCVLA